MTLNRVLDAGTEETGLRVESVAQVAEWLDGDGNAAQLKRKGRSPDRSSGTCCDINDAVHAYLDAEEAKGALLDRVRPLISRLQLIGTSVAATISTLSQSAVGPLEEVLELVIPAVTWNASAARGLSTAPAARLEGQIRHLYESWPAAAVLPTVDARPLDQVED